MVSVDTTDWSFDTIKAQRHILCYSIPILMMGSEMVLLTYFYYIHIVWPDLFFCKHLNLVVNKQDWRIMKTTMKIFLAFPLFWNWRSKIRLIFSNEVHERSKLSKYVILNAGLFLYIYWIWLVLDIEKCIWRSDLCCFRPSILKQWKGQKYFLTISIVLWSCLFTIKLRCLQKKSLVTLTYVRTT